MTKIDIFSGFLGAGKTTLIKKLLKEALAGTKVVLIENEFGEIGVDGGFLQEAGIQIKEMNSGCICCSLVGDFGSSLKEVLDKYEPERILIEPSGVGKLSDVIKAVQGVDMSKNVTLNSAVAVVDAKKCKMYMKNFGEFFINQIESAGTIILSRTKDMPEEKLLQVVEMIKEHNDHATIITTDWDELKGEDILASIESKDQMAEDLLHEVEEHHHHHDDDDEEECCCCGHHHHDHDHEHEHHHHDHDHDEHEHHHHDHDHDEHEHHHHDHDHDEHEHHHHHHHHDADEIFTSWGMETPAKYSMERISEILKALDDQETYGIILRAKGMVPSEDGQWVYFDYVPEESNVRQGQAQVTGKFCVIGSNLKEDKLQELFAK